MSQSILLIVLAAAALDAVMHLFLKAEGDCRGMSVLTGIIGGVLGVLALPFTGLPDMASLPWLVLSACWGFAYWVVLGRAYEGGALGLVFPLARGAGVLLTTGFAAVFLAERLSLAEMAMVGAIVAGLVLVAVNGMSGWAGLRGLGPTVLLAGVICGYTVTDAVGVREAGSALAYCAVLYALNGVMLAGFALRSERARIVALGVAAVPRAAGLAAMSAVVYGLVLFAMQRESVAVVAALAETSIVFAAALGFVWLREPARAAHALGVVIIAGGAGMMHFAG